MRRAQFGTVFAWHKPVVGFLSWFGRQGIVDGVDEDDGVPFGDGVVLDWTHFF